MAAHFLRAAGGRPWQRTFRERQAGGLGSALLASEGEALAAQFSRARREASAAHFSRAPGGGPWQHTFREPGGGLGSALFASARREALASHFSRAKGLRSALFASARRGALAAHCSRAPGGRPWQRIFREPGGRDALAARQAVGLGCALFASQAFFSVFLSVGAVFANWYLWRRFAGSQHKRKQFLFCLVLAIVLPYDIYSF